MYMTYTNIKKCVLLFGFAVASGAIGVSAQEGITNESAREKLLQETFQLLDKVESNSPGAHIDLVRIRERVMAIHQNPVVTGLQSIDSNPELLFSRQKDTHTKRLGKRLAFSNSLKGLRDQELRKRLHDSIINHKFYDYSEARRFVILQVDNYDSYTECVYTGKVVSARTMPDSKIMNIEHTWPQSKGATGPAKSDMHHLFPTDSVANSTRSSLCFGDVTNPKWEVGGSKCDGKRYEVRKENRGNTARAMFYFATCYDKSIGQPEEETLRRWNKEDPIDAKEKSRNERIEVIQGNRNPFIDNPEFIDQIIDF